MSQINHSEQDEAPSNAYLVFQMNDSDYAIHVEHVREIITSIEPSPVPGSPDYLSGVINLRGRILPMISLRRRFGFPIVDKGDRDCFVILSLKIGNELVELGIDVDGVSEVSRISDDAIDPTNTISDYANSLIFTGVAKTASGIKLVLDSESLIGQLKQDVQSQFQRRPLESFDPELACQGSPNASLTPSMT